LHRHVLCYLQMNGLDESKIVAEDVCGYRRKGRDARSRVLVFRPELAPKDKNGDWRCGIFIEGMMKKPTFAMGVGPVDALMNASRLLISKWEELGCATPRASGVLKPK
jgi:hypothetical protein